MKVQYNSSSYRFEVIEPWLTKSIYHFPKFQIDPGFPVTKVYYKYFSEQVDGIEEECFYHSFDTNDGMACACLFNHNLGDCGMGFFIRYDSRQLPVFLQWKMMRSREYVCGLNPATTNAEGRKQALEKNETMFLAPLEKKTFTIELGVVEGDAFLKNLS